MANQQLTVRQVMQSEPAIARSDSTVQEVIRLMNELRIGAVMVVSEGGALEGIFTERDLVSRVVSAVPGWREYPIRDWMTRDPHTIAPDVDWEQAVAAMQKFRVRHLPVLDQGRVVGIVSSRALMSRRSEYLNLRIEARTQELRRANDQLLARETELLHNLRAAGRLQTQLLLPHAPPEWPELTWAVHFAPLDHLGGDYYDMAEPGPDHLGFLIADASGHSVAAAMVAIMARFAFGEVAGSTASPGQVLQVMNLRLQTLSDERFVTAFYGVLNRSTRQFRFANAGHPYPLWLQKASGRVRSLNAQGFLLGVIPDEVYTEREITLDVGDMICFYTDGVIEARNEIGEMFGSERLEQCLLQYAELPCNQVLQRLLEELKRFGGGVPLTDDLTLAICQLNPYNKTLSPGTE